MEDKEQSCHVVVGSPDPSKSECEASCINARQRKVKQALQLQAMNIKENSAPPVIAVMGSGGGLRAMIGFLGTLIKLAELKLLDVVTYVSGTSGSTWCLYSLGQHENWSDPTFMKHMENSLSSRLSSSWDWKKGWQKLKETFLEDTFSLTNIWGYFVVNAMIKEINEDKLSDHKHGCKSGDNPYPIYSAVEKECMAKNDPGAWFEFTPHFSGFPAHGCFVKTELLGSKFEAGKLLSEYPESELCYLAGMWGSAFASNEVVRDQIKNIFHFFTSGSQGLPSRNVLKLFEDAAHGSSNILIKQFAGLHWKYTFKKDWDADSLCKCKGCVTFRDILSQDSDDIPKEEQETIWKGFAETLEGAIEILLAGSDADGTCPSGICDDCHVLRHSLACLTKWKWGTMNNFLYKLKGDNPSTIFGKEQLSLIDAGLEINVAFPLMLPPHRKIDLFLSFDYSQGDPFLTLKQTAEYCEKNGLHFPKINISDNDKDIPSKCCYIFEGDGQETPDIMHFPLFNNQTCEGNVETMRAKYSTDKISYEETLIKDLLEVAKNNVAASADDIRQKISEWVDKCNQKRAT